MAEPNVSHSFFPAYSTGVAVCGAMMLLNENEKCIHDDDDTEREQRAAAEKSAHHKNPEYLLMPTANPPLYSCYPSVNFVGSFSLLLLLSRLGKAMFFSLFTLTEESSCSAV